MCVFYLCVLSINSSVYYLRKVKLKNTVPIILWTLLKINNNYLIACTTSLWLNMWLHKCASFIWLVYEQYLIFCLLGRLKPFLATNGLNKNHIWLCIFQWCKLLKYAHCYISLSTANTTDQHSNVYHQSVFVVALVLTCKHWYSHAAQYIWNYN